jgi:hypothetical protein
MWWLVRLGNRHAMGTVEVGSSHHIGGFWMLTPALTGSGAAAGCCIMIMLIGAGSTSCSGVRDHFSRLPATLSTC